MKEQNYIASLVRGETYLIRNRDGGSDLYFTKGVELVIRADLYEYLAVTAIDEVVGELDLETGEREVISKAKFVFRPCDGDLSPGAIFGADPVAAPFPHRKQKAA